MKTTLTLHFPFAINIQKKDLTIYVSSKISEGCAIIDQIIVPQIPNQNKRNKFRKTGKTETENLKVEE